MSRPQVGRGSIPFCFEHPCQRICQRTSQNEPSRAVKSTPPRKTKSLVSEDSAGREGAQQHGPARSRKPLSLRVPWVQIPLPPHHQKAQVTAVSADLGLHSFPAAARPLVNDLSTYVHVILAALRRVTSRLVDARSSCVAVPRSTCSGDGGSPGLVAGANAALPLQPGIPPGEWSRPAGTTSIADPQGPVPLHPGPGRRRQQRRRSQAGGCGPGRSARNAANARGDEDHETPTPFVDDAAGEATQ